MTSNDVRKNLKAKGDNPAGNSLNEMEQGNSLVEMKESSLTLTITVGCSNFLSLVCC